MDKSNSTPPSRGLLHALHVELLDQGKSIQAKMSSISKDLEQFSQGETALLPVLKEFDQKAKAIASYLNEQAKLAESTAKQANLDLENSLTKSLMSFASIFESIAKSRKKSHFDYFVIGLLIFNLISNICVILIVSFYK